ncbi:MAG: protein kinase [Acidobacteriota bacterium]|nr:protein kinase [Acidobacteriota bacterium]
MTPERWQQVEEVLQGALDRPPRDRASFLTDACSGDDELKQEAASLISAYDEAGDFIEQPAMAIDARVLVGHEIENKLGADIGPYRIVERLGEGGMGEVYLAHDARLNRLVALKILPAYFASDDTRLRRFQREAQAASALNHPNILTIHEVGEAEEVRFIATEFIDGQTIRELIAQEELSLDQILDIGEQVASALASAHAAGIVHRDIKPENIMRRHDGLVKLLDFGIAKLMEPRTAEYSRESQSGVAAQTEAGLVMGTVSYMSPEQARGLPVDERTDIWSLGVVLYEMLARRLPFASATRMDTIVAILEREPPSISESANAFYPGSTPLQQVIEKALRKDVSKRYQTTTELLSDLNSVTQLLKTATPLDDDKQRKFGQQLGRRKTATKAGLHQHRYVWPLLAVLLFAIAIAGTLLYRRSVLRLPATGSGSPATTSNKLYAQMSETEKLRFIDEQEQRISMMMGDRPVRLNQEALGSIKAYVDQYVARDNLPAEPGAESLNVIYSRARLYVPLIAREFAARKVPVIIGIYLPVIESSYRNCYENSFGARGLFQFLPQTAEQYGVTHDEMCDPQKMTPAAAHYIADRMAELGEDSESLTLVLLSYNRGPEWVRGTLRELRGTANYERNFWTLFAHRDELDAHFRSENAGYVPNFFAAAIIGENPQTFGLAMPALSTQGGGR